MNPVPAAGPAAYYALLAGGVALALLTPAWLLWHLARRARAARARRTLRHPADGDRL